MKVLTETKQVYSNSFFTYRQTTSHVKLGTPSQHLPWSDNEHKHILPQNWGRFQYEEFSLDSISQECFSRSGLFLCCHPWKGELTLIISIHNLWISVDWKNKTYLSVNMWRILRHVVGVLGRAFGLPSQVSNACPCHLLLQFASPDPLSMPSSSSLQLAMLDRLGYKLFCDGGGGMLAWLGPATEADVDGATGLDVISGAPAMENRLRLW